MYVVVRRAPERNATIGFQGLKPGIGFAASLLAVWCQILLLATIALAPAGAAADALGGSPICHSDDGSQPPSQPGHADHNCVLCASCISHALPFAILAPVQMLPDQQLVVSLHRYPTQPRAPPVRRAATAQPRGPPSTI